jgi:hypothetical protein
MSRDLPPQIFRQLDYGRLGELRGSRLQEPALIAAGMAVIGVLAASHIQPNHGQRLRSAGAEHVAQSFGEAKRLTHQFLDAMSM